MNKNSKYWQMRYNNRVLHLVGGNTDMNSIDARSEAALAINNALGIVIHTTSYDLHNKRDSLAEMVDIVQREIECGITKIDEANGDHVFFERPFQRLSSEIISNAIQHDVPASVLADMIPSFAHAIKEGVERSRKLLAAESHEEIKKLSDAFEPLHSAVTERKEQGHISSSNRGWGGWFGKR
jgi:hypothetical protein